ncbi:MAG: hypothetical protein BHV87_09285 [Clostridiales bacterium 36_14]|nr:MAG: hypothetical protein BHV87_09285 [Clostridiales bacterium 36_14]
MFPKVKYYKILEHPLYGRMADTGIIGVLTHDGYMEFVVPNCETSVETPDKKEDTHEEEIEKIRAIEGVLRVRTMK